MFNKKRIEALERESARQKKDIETLQGELNDMRVILGALLTEGVEVQTEVQFIPDNTLDLIN